jgi:hypothetical protein
MYAILLEYLGKIACNFKQEVTVHVRMVLRHLKESWYQALIFWNPKNNEITLL